MQKPTYLLYRVSHGALDAFSRTVSAVSYASLMHTGHDAFYCAAIVEKHAPLFKRPYRNLDGGFALGPL